MVRGLVDQVTEWWNPLRVVSFEALSWRKDTFELCPTIYLIQRGARWRQAHIPLVREQELIEEYVARLAGNSSFHTTSSSISSGATKKNRMYAGPAPWKAVVKLAHQHLTKCNEKLLDLSLDDGCVSYDQLYRDLKLAVVVNLEEIQTNADAKKQFTSVLHQIMDFMLIEAATTPHNRRWKKIMLVPVCLDLAPSKRLLGTRYAGLRRGLPIVLRELAVSKRRDFLAECIDHFNKSMVIPLPSSSMQMELLELATRLYLPPFCVTSTCFSLRQIACVNEEMLQTFWRIRDHPNMKRLFRAMIEYHKQLTRLGLTDQDVICASQQEAHCMINCPARMSNWTRWSLIPVILGKTASVSQYFTHDHDVCELVSAFDLVVLIVLRIGVICCGLWFVHQLSWYRSCSSVVIMTIVLGLWLAFELLLSNKKRRCQSQHQPQCDDWRLAYLPMKELQRKRQDLCQQVRQLKQSYQGRDLPSPVIIRRELDCETFLVNAHHDLFLNAHKCFPLELLEKMPEVNNSKTVARRVREWFYLPNLLRSAKWRRIYDMIAPRHLKLASLESCFTENGLLLRKLRQNVYFEWVLEAYELFHQHKDDRTVLYASLQQQDRDSSSCSSGSSGDESERVESDQEFELRASVLKKQRLLVLQKAWQLASDGEEEDPTDDDDVADDDDEEELTEEADAWDEERDK